MIHGMLAKRPCMRSGADDRCSASNFQSYQYHFSSKKKGIKFISCPQSYGLTEMEMIMAPDHEGSDIARKCTTFMSTIAIKADFLTCGAVDTGIMCPRSGTQ